MGKRKIRIIWHGFKGRRKVRDPGANALKNLGNSVLEEQRKKRRIQGEGGAPAPGILKEIKRWFVKQFSKICPCGFWKRSRVGTFGPVIPDIPCSSGLALHPDSIYTAESPPIWQLDFFSDDDDYSDDEYFHQKFNGSILQLPKIRRIRHVVKKMKENEKRIQEIQKEYRCSPTPILNNIMQDVNLPGMLVDDHFRFSIQEKDKNNNDERLYHSPVVSTSPPMSGFFLHPRPIGFWCPLDITLETAQNITMKFPQCKIPTLFEAMTAAERYSTRLRIVKLKEDIKNMNIQNLTESLTQNNDTSTTTPQNDQEMEPNASAERKNSADVGKDIGEVQEQKVEFHKDVETSQNDSNRPSPNAKPIRDLSGEAEVKLNCEENKFSKENQEEKNQSISENTTHSLSSSATPDASQNEEPLKDQSNLEKQNLTIFSKKSTEGEVNGKVHASRSIQNDTICSKIATPVTDDEIADMIKEIENDMNGWDSA